MKRGKPLQRKRMKKKPPPDGFSDQVKHRVRVRAGWKCEAKTAVCTDEPYHFHHRKLRRHKDHSEANCMFVCTQCHINIHANPTMSYLMGWLVHSYDEPSEIAIRYGSRG